MLTSWHSAQSLSHKKDVIMTHFLAGRRFAPAPVAGLVLLLALGACAGAPYDVQGAQCDAASHQALVGRNIGEVYLPPNLPKREVNARNGQPEGVMTGDFRPSRLTMFLDPKGWIVGVACG